MSDTEINPKNVIFDIFFLCRYSISILRPEILKKETPKKKENEQLVMLVNIKKSEITSFFVTYWYPN